MNPNYVGTNLNFGAFAIEQRIKAKWANTWMKASPILACIHDRGLHVNKGFDVQGLKAIIPINYAAVAGFTTGNAGIADNAQTPAAWPTWDQTAGFTQAEYEYTHLERSLIFEEAERQLAFGGARGNLKEGKIDQLLLSFKSIMADMISGSANGSRTALLGIDYLIATNNTVGGIDRTVGGNASFRGNVVAAGSAVSFTLVDDMFDSICRECDGDGTAGGPDLMMLSNVSGGPNIYGRFRDLISPQRRFDNEDFKVKYGITSYMYNDMKCVMETRGVGGAPATGQIRLITTDVLYYGGYEAPKAHQEIRIPGSSTVETRYVHWAFLGCDNPRRLGKITTLSG